MSDLPKHARVVIIGGGAIGASSLYHLAKMGWSDCVLLEKNELTAGSTWHAAGNVPTFSTSWSIMNMQRYSTELYRKLGKIANYPMNYHVTGSVRLAHTEERMQEFARAVGMGTYQGMSLELLGIDDIKSKYPFLETHDLKGALYDPADGDIDPAQLTQALAKAARDLGAKIYRFTPATGVRREGNQWIVRTEKGEITCEYVVNAAGYYAQRVGEWFKPYGGRTVPMMVMSHQYLLTEEIPEIAKWSAETGHKLPLLRDVDSSYYLRQEKAGFNLGPYERNCKAHWVRPDEPMPEDFSFQLYPDDLDRLEWYIDDALKRVPLLEKAGISKVINGPIPYAPDGLPLLGPMPGVPNAFEACVFTFGIAQAGGAGKVLAEWITQGYTEWDMWAVDPRRYTDYTDQDYCVQKGMETYGHEYDMHFPHATWPAARDKKRSPIYEKSVELGAVMGVYNGWERPNWYAKSGDDISHEAARTWGRSGPWEARIKEECEAVRDHVGVLDLPGFSRFELSGEGAADWLLGMITGNLPKINKMSLAYFSDMRGRVLTEMSVLRHRHDQFTLITAAVAQWHDYEILAKSLPPHLAIRDVTKNISTLIVSGPKSRELLKNLTDGDLQLPWLSLQQADVIGRQVLLVRVSFAGELGWEIHAANEDIPAIYEAVIDGGAKPFGMFALNSLRIEKGYRAWKGDLSTDYSILESRLDRFLNLNKSENFVGKDAIAHEKNKGRMRAFVILIVEAGFADAPYMSTIWDGKHVVGETTSGAWGYRVNASVALGMINVENAVSGKKLEIEIYGKRYLATVQPEGPLWDPNNERIRA